MKCLKCRGLAVCEQVDESNEGLRYLQLRCLNCGMMALA